MPPLALMCPMVVTKNRGNGRFPLSKRRLVLTAIGFFALGLGALCIRSLVLTAPPTTTLASSGAVLLEPGPALHNDNTDWVSNLFGLRPSAVASLQSTTANVNAKKGETPDRVHPTTAEVVFAYNDHDNNKHASVGEKDEIPKEAFAVVDEVFTHNANASVGNDSPSPWPGDKGVPSKFVETPAANTNTGGATAAHEGNAEPLSAMTASEVVYSGGERGDDDIRDEQSPPVILHGAIYGNTAASSDGGDAGDTRVGQPAARNDTDILHGTVFGITGTLHNDHRDSDTPDTLATPATLPPTEYSAAAQRLRPLDAKTGETESTHTIASVRIGTHMVSPSDAREYGIGGEGAAAMCDGGIVRYNETHRDLVLPELERLQGALSSASADRVLAYPYGPNAKFAYAFYVTDSAYACSALVALRALKNTRPRDDIDIVVVHPDNEQVPRELLDRAKEMGAILAPTKMPYTAKGSKTLYRDCFLKLTVFQLYQYDRVLITDSDSLILRNLDHLFHVPRAPLVIPHAHWLEASAPHAYIPTSILMLVEPSKETWEKRIVQKYFGDGNPYQAYDMDLVSAEFATDALFLPAQYGQLDTSLEMFLRESIGLLSPRLGDIARSLLRLAHNDTSHVTASDAIAPDWVGKERLLYLHAQEGVPDAKEKPPGLVSPDEAYMSLSAIPGLVLPHEEAGLRTYLQETYYDRLRTEHALAESLLVHFSSGNQKPWMDESLPYAMGPVAIYPRRLWRRLREGLC